MYKLNFDKKTLRRFSFTMSIAFLIIATIILIKHKHSIGIPILFSGIFFILALIKPSFLKSLYILWMGLATILGWINTRLILFVVFYLVCTPIGLLMKLFGADLLNIKINRSKNTYWIAVEKKEFNPSDYERQF